MARYKNNFSFQSSHIDKYFQIMKIELHYRLLIAMVQYFPKSWSFSKVCHTAVFLVKALNVVDFLMCLSQVDVY